MPADTGQAHCGNEHKETSREDLCTDPRGVSRSFAFIPQESGCVAGCGNEKTACYAEKQLPGGVRAYPGM